jgi:hypothetical protein
LHHPLAAGEGFTLVVSWPKGYIQAPTGEARFRYFLEDNQPTLVGAAGLLVVLSYYLIVWFLVGRGPAKSEIVPIYEPPAGLSPAAMRYLVRMGFDDKTFTTAILDMAVKDYLSIKESGGAGDRLNQLMPPRRPRSCLTSICPTRWRSTASWHGRNSSRRSSKMQSKAMITRHTGMWGTVRIR